MNEWEEKLRCPHCEQIDSYDVLSQMQGKYGIAIVECTTCGSNITADYYPVMEFKVRDLEECE